MNNISKGIISLSDDLVITSGYTFDQFQSTRYYKGQNPERAFWLEEKFMLQEFMLQGHTFMAGLFFRNGVIYMLSLLCCDLEFGMEEEKKRKELHDKILQSWGIGRSDQEWGYVESVYDARSNISNIHVIGTCARRRTGSGTVHRRHTDQGIHGQKKQPMHIENGRESGPALIYG